MADNAKTAQTAEELEQLLNELGEVETFAPPPEFRARARITDPDRLWIDLEGTRLHPNRVDHDRR